MSDIGALVERLVEAGLSIGEASSIIAEAVAAGAATAAYRKSPGAIRTERWRENRRHKASQSVTERHENETSPTVTKRHEPSQCDANTVLPIEDKIKNTSKRNSERASRGTRIDPDWSPSPAEREFATSEGLSPSEIDREAARFRDYWKGRAGSGGVKLDWTATWQNWVRTTAEKLGRSPRRSDGQPVSNMFHAKFGSEELDAWDAYTRGKTGKFLPRDSKGGWTVPTQWPPGYERRSSVEPIQVPRLKSI
jgi:hypothetical protein